MPEKKQKKTTGKKTTTKTPRKSGSKKQQEKARQSFPIVGIGASAGGLEAIQGFFQNLTPKCNAAFVVIQHRGTESKDLMPKLLQKYTELKILEVENEIEVQPGHIYINPPHVNMRIENGKIYCNQTDKTLAARMPIDHFFGSLAEDQQQRGICVVLSGTGSDGTLGLREIKAAGGMAMVQEEKQAKYSGMPRSAIETGLPDFILPVEKMPEELNNYFNHPYIESPQMGEDKTFENILKKIFRFIYQKTGHDFSEYKTNTITRRIKRRMAIHQISGVEDYLKFIKENDKELGKLFREITITVTNFFRDPEVHKVLKEKVIHHIIHNKPIDSSVRIWIPGCSTGEEAYSIAILLCEVLDELDKRLNVQIFATDIEEGSIEKARSGRYPNSIESHVSKQRLEKYFIKDEHVYRVKDELREMIVFAPQSIIKDPPFMHLDLISCRNVLIYMGPGLQEKVIRKFHFALNPDGYLLLGTSETIGKFADLFSIVENRNRIFKKKPHYGKHYDDTRWQSPLAGTDKPDQQKKENDGQGKDIEKFAERVILDEYAPPCVLVDDKGDIIFYNGDTSPFLAQPGGKPTMNILKLIRPEFHYTLSMLLHKSEKKHNTVKSESLDAIIDGSRQRLEILVRPLKQRNQGQKMKIVIFDAKKRNEAEKEKQPQIDQYDTYIKNLEQELSATKECLQTTIEELETSNEELKSSNEELQSTNEELQSTNEELETSREELQSANEELKTKNDEYQVKLSELCDAKDDLSNLLKSMNILTIFLDTEMNIRKFTPEAADIFKIADRDIGRPLSDIVNCLEYENLEKDCKAVLDDLSKKQQEIKTWQDKWYRVNITPYKTADNIIDGVVITAIDITYMKDAQKYAESIVETIRQPLLVLDSDLKVKSANRSFYRFFKEKPENTINKFIYHLGNRQWDVPELKELLENILPDNNSFEDYKLKGDFDGIGKKELSLNARRVLEKDKDRERILLAIGEITDKQHSR